MNVPNALTITRIVLTPVVLAAYMLNFPAHFLVATILYFIAGMTDFFDGKIARSKNLITNFGKFADPLADKMLTTAVYLALISNGYCNIWILFIILFREFGISSIRLRCSSTSVSCPRASRCTRCRVSCSGSPPSSRPSPASPTSSKAPRSSTFPSKPYSKLRSFS